MPGACSHSWPARTVHGVTRRVDPQATGVRAFPHTAPGCHRRPGATLSEVVERSDEQLMRATRAGEAEAFGELFARHRALVLAYLTRRCAREEAADLLAETFAAALLAVHDARAPRGPTAAPWLLTIARHKLFDLHRRGRVEDEARRRLSLERIVPGDEDLRRIDALGADVDAALEGLPSDQRAALRARVLEEREYEEIARDLDASETAIRQRVSRALRRLRADFGGM